MKRSERLAQFEKHNASLANSASERGRSRPLSGTRSSARQSGRPARSPEPRRALGPEPDARALARPVAQRPAEAGMQAAGVGRRRIAGIFDLDRDAQRGIRQAIFDREPESEGIERAGAVVVAQGEADEVPARASTAKVSNRAKPCRPSG